jgi:hypothetical protein
MEPDGQNFDNLLVHRGILIFIIKGFRKPGDILFIVP